MMRVVLLFIIANIVVFGLQMAIPWLTDTASLVPTQALSGMIWQFFTYMWLHADFMHIFINMFILAIFGFVVEARLGWKWFLILYTLSGLGAAGLHIALTGISDIPMLGASGAVFGIITAFGLLFPTQIIIMFPGIPMPAIAAVFVFAAIEVFFGISGLEPGVANWGHLGGIATGMVFVMVWKRYEVKRRRLRFVWE